MTLKELAVESRGLGRRVKQALLDRQSRGVEPATQLALAHASGVSRQTLSNVISTDRITPTVAMLLARALHLPAEALVPEITQSNGRRVVSEPSATYAGGQRSRVWLADLRAELTKAGSTDAEIEAAVALVTAPEVFTYYSGGKPRELSEDQALEGMEAIAEGVIRPRLRGRRKK